MFKIIENNINIFKLRKFFKSSPYDTRIESISNECATQTISKSTLFDASSVKKICKTAEQN